MLRWRNIFVVLFLCIYSMTGVEIAFGQTWNLPDNRKNTRFYNDIFTIKRPGLSINGFDDGGNHSKGYGLKQILEMLYNGSADPLMVDTYNKIVGISKQPLDDPFNSNNPLNSVNLNSNILQSRAFVALARYVLYKNGITAQIPGATQTAPSHEVALADLKQAFSGTRRLAAGLALSVQSSAGSRRKLTPES
jgi:hypothetical protein